MHYCLLDRERFKSRIRWYQCFEHLNTKKTPIKLYRFYNQDLFVPSSAIAAVPTEWIKGYEQRGIDMSSVRCQSTNWSGLHRELYPQGPEKIIADPRRPADKLVHRWLRWTQPDFCHYADRRLGRSLMYRTVQKALALWGW
jgi:hypothetical protein